MRNFPATLKRLELYQQTLFHTGSLLRSHCNHRLAGASQPGFHIQGAAPARIHVRHLGEIVHPGANLICPSSRTQLGQQAT